MFRTITFLPILPLVGMAALTNAHDSSVGAGSKRSSLCALEVDETTQQRNRVTIRPLNYLIYERKEMLMVNCKKTKFMWKTSVFAIATLVMGPFGFAQEEAPALVDMTVRLIVDQKSGQAFWSGVTFPYEPHLLSETSLGYYVATRATNERKRLEGVVETCRKAEKCNFVIDSR